jgi:HD superfamily phosphohydrolase
VTTLNFSEKTICDNVHGSIGISALEQQVINSRTFQRLKRIKQLGLASMVFPGAEHSRFAHSIGVMHVMSMMVDRLRVRGCEHVSTDQTKQKLRLAALLHDIGHYPLAHLGEQVFQWVDSYAATQLISLDDENSKSLLAEAAEPRKSGAAKHERLGETILTHEHSELRQILERSGYDPQEIARIINGEAKENPFYIQLMSSTLDCDRIDYLLRDSAAAGTSYGRVDIEYIIRNIQWDKTRKYICFSPKASNAIEHFIMARYFSYNITFHKTIVGLELMAKTLFFSMIRDMTLVSKEYGPIVRSIADIEKKIKTDEAFLANFNDEYFWYYLDLWNPSEPMLQELKQRLLKRITLRTVHEERVLHEEGGADRNPRYSYVAGNLIDDIFNHRDYSQEFQRAGITRDRIFVLSRPIKLEQVAYSSNYRSREPDELSRLKVVKIWDGETSEDLMSSPSSIVRILSDFELKIARVFALVDKNSEAEHIVEDTIAKILEERFPS